MPALHLSARDGAPEPIRAGLARLREELEVPEDFPSAVLAEAEWRRPRSTCPSWTAPTWRW